MHHICRGCRLGAVLIWCTSHLLSRPRYVTVSLHARIFWYLHQRKTTYGLGMIRVHRRIRVNNVLLGSVPSRDQGSLVCFCCRRCIPCFGRPGAFVTCHIFFGESLFDCLCLPIIVSDSATSFNDPGSKLTEHGLCSDDSNLPRTVRVGQDFLVNQLVFLLLGSDDFM